MILILVATRLEAAAPRLMLPRLHHTYYIKQREKISINMCCEKLREKKREREREAKGDE